MAFTQTVHGSEAENVSDAASSFATTADILVGDVFLVEAYGDDNDQSSVTGIGTNSLTKLGGQVNTATHWSNIWYGILTQQINNAATITVNWPGNSRPKGCRGFSYRPGASTTAELSATSTNAGTGTTLTPGSASLSGSDVGFAHVTYVTDDNTTQTTPTNYTIAAAAIGAIGTPALELASFYRLLTVASAENPSCTRGAGTIWWRSNIVVYREVGGAAPATSLIWQPAQPSLYKR